jgi:hypothetical protein
MHLPPGFVPPCLPTKASQPPSGDLWLHEIKHDGFQVVAREDADRVRLYSRHRVQAKGLALPLRALAGLAQIEEPGLCCRKAGGGGRLGAALIF